MGTFSRQSGVKLRGAAAVPEARPGRVGLFPVGGVVLGDAALELLPAHRFQLALAVGQPALHPEGQALPEAQLLRPRLHQLGAAEDVLGAVLPGEPVGQPGEQLLFGAHRAEVGHEVVVAARGAVGHVFLHKKLLSFVFDALSITQMKGAEQYILFGDFEGGRKFVFCDRALIIW